MKLEVANIKNSTLVTHREPTVGPLPYI